MSHLNMTLCPENIHRMKLDKERIKYLDVLIDNMLSQQGSSRRHCFEAGFNLMIANSNEYVETGARLIACVVYVQ